MDRHDIGYTYETNFNEPTWFSGPNGLNLEGRSRKDESNEWIKFGMRLGVSAALHPFEYAKVLIQIGYEPIAPRPGRLLFGNPKMMLPNIFQYVKYIKKVDGLVGCYRGVVPKLFGTIAGSVGSEWVVKKLDVKDYKPSGQSDDTELFLEFKQTLKRDIILHSSAILLAQPFHVISVRMMAQFVGNETIYSGIRASIKEIWANEGICGFFSGFIPKLLFDISCLVAASTTIYFVKQMFIKDPEGRQYAGSFIHFVSSSIFYPLQVVSTCMTVKGSRLVAARPPQMPDYTNWYNCWSELHKNGDHKRGSSLFFRYCRPTPSFRSDNIPFPTLSKK